LPDAIAAAAAAGLEVGEAEIAQALQRGVDLVERSAQRVGHAVPAVERRAVSIGGERQQHEHGDTVRTELGKPAFEQQRLVEPPEAP
jgi:hypothetical protein